MIPAYLLPLADHLWQSSLFTAAVAIVNLALRKNRAAVRHRLWLAASVKFLIPFSLLVGVGSHFHWRTAPATEPPPISIFMDEIGRPFTASDLPTVPLSSEPAPQPSRIPAALIFVWLCGFAASIVSWSSQWRRLRRAMRQAKVLNLDVPIRVMCCPERVEPGVFGIIRPALLLPEGITDRLSPAQLKAVLAHEMCHVRRRDNLTAAIHMLVEASFWFHPLVWWIKVRLIEEQERACDEEVLRLGGDPQVYAESILKICEFYVTSPLICVAGITGSDLKKRIAAVMTGRISRELNLTRRLLLAAVGMLAIVGPIVAGLVNAPLTRAQSTAAAIPQWEVVSIKPCKAGDGGGRGGGGIGHGPRISPGRLAIECSKEDEATHVSQAASFEDATSYGSLPKTALVSQPVLPLTTTAFKPPSPLLQSTTQSAAQVPPALQFEVASVKPWNNNVPAGVPLGAVRFLPGGRLSAAAASLSTFIQIAYEVRFEQLIGLPDWNTSGQYDIEATAPDNPTKAQMRLMLRSLLEDRFKLKAHREMREMPVLELVLLKDDARLKNSAKGDCKPGDVMTANGDPDFTPCGNIIMHGGPDGARMDGGNLSMALFVMDLTAQFNQPVIDKTGYTGTFDLHLRFTPAMRLNADSTDPTIYTALEEQLGLKLNSTKAPVEVFVIDSIQKPIPN